MQTDTVEAGGSTGRLPSLPAITTADKRARFTPSPTLTVATFTPTRTSSFPSILATTSVLWDAPTSTRGLTMLTGEFDANSLAQETFH